jgi:DNA-binding transcriptional LysR family regulator
MLVNIDIDLLRTIVTIAEAGSFSRAAERLLRTQSAVSLQMKRLEEAVGQRLMDRNARSVTLTPQGERLLTYARRMIALNDELVGTINEPDLEGKVRLGTPEDFATTRLPDVLARFSQAYPRVALEVTCDLTLNLLDGFRQDQFDLVLVKREPVSAGDGVRVWREPLVWVAGPGQFDVGDQLPLVLSPPPCVYRKRAIDTLELTGRHWRLAYVCASLAGSIAAVKAGLGVTVLPKEMVPAGLRTLEADQLPGLPDTEIALLSARTLSDPAARLQDHIVKSLEQRK